MSDVRIKYFVRDLQKLLTSNDCADDVFIYYLGKRSHYDGHSDWVVEDGYDPKDISEYMNGVINLTFEGTFYEIINGYWTSNVVDEFLDLLREYCLWYELGNAWNMSIYDEEGLC